MRVKTPEMTRAQAHLALATRWYGADSREAADARRELAAAKLARARAEVDVAAAELAELDKAAS